MQSPTSLLMPALFTLAAAALAVPAAEAALAPETRKEILIREHSRNLDDGVLLELVADPDPEVRARAILAVGRIQDPATTDALLPALHDDDPAVRHAAIFAVGQMEDPGLQPVILGALEEAPAAEFRAALLHALGKCGDEGAVEILAGYLDEGDPVTGPAAAQALGRLALDGTDIAAAGKALDRAVAHENPEIAWRAGYAMHRGRVKEYNGIRHAIKSDDVRVRIYGARAAEGNRNKMFIDPVLDLTGDEDWRVRVEAIKALRGIRIPKLWEGRISLLLEDPSDHVRFQAIELLAEIDGLNRLTQFANSSDWLLRSTYLKALPTAKGPGALVDLRQASRDPDWRIRKAAAEAFDAYEDEQGLLLLEPMLKDEMPAVRLAAISSVIPYPQLEAMKFLRDALGTDDTAVLTAAAAGCGERMDRDAVAPLLDAYDPLLSPIDSDAMVAILDALGRILTATEEEGAAGTLAESDRKRAVAVLESAANDEDPGVAGAAFRSLTGIRGDEDASFAPPPSLPPSFDAEVVLATETLTVKPLARIYTSRGEVVIELDPQAAPATVANFVSLSREGFYNGLRFHRVVSDFVVQTGDPRGDGWGGPGYTIRCEYGDLPYATGTVGMAHAGKDTGGSQFFITHSPQPHLEGRYTVFGRVLEGQDVVDRIRVGDTIEEVVLEGF